MTLGNMLQKEIGNHIVIPQIGSPKLGLPNLPKSPDIGQNSDESISHFWISGQFLINENCHNSRTSNDIDMKLGSVTKLKRNNNIKKV